MRQMFSLKQILTLIDSEGVEAVRRAIGSGEIQVGGVDALAPEYDATATYKAGDMVIYEDALYQAKADINTAEAWDSTHWEEATIIPAVRGFLNGKFVRIIDAPTSTTLTDEQINIFKGGVFINGSFAGKTNPIIMPFSNPSTGGYLISGSMIQVFYISNHVFNLRNEFISFNRDYGKISITGGQVDFYAREGGVNLDTNHSLGLVKIYAKEVPLPPTDNSGTYSLIFKGTELEWYKPIAVTGITSGDDLAGVQDGLVNAMKNHLDVEINGHRCRFEKDDGTYIMYSWKDEADSGVNLQINMISLLIASPNTISFNLMKFAPVV